MTTTRRAFFEVSASAALLLFAAQAQAANFTFSQTFNASGFSGTLSGAFSAVDANADGQFDISEITFTNLSYAGTAPTLGVVNLSYSSGFVVSNNTNWYVTDKTLGDISNGFFVGVASASSPQLSWVAGPANGFDFGNTPNTNSGGDPQNNTNFKFGQIDLFSSSSTGGTALGTGVSRTYAVVNPAAVPEPSTYLMLLAGIATVGVLARRRAA